uniref:(California timema) hypothetical protein n=1 Tax=Timema californicum TaxID=61474 RepID=A0A7R9J5B0_TIMCA|nr:unnamed protein product [Timema californicum]
MRIFCFVKLPVCFTSLNPWLCLHCGNIGCGRYVNGHAKEHCEQSSDHCLCMDCDSLAIYCTLHSDGRVAITIRLQHELKHAGAYWRVHGVMTHATRHTTSAPLQ